jgi:exopolyphosphatase/guanosine-5'-triphosphate,3'-diphosphate pyrophosphatase
VHRAVISIGTNSTRALLAAFDADASAIVWQRSIGTRIGEGLRESGHLGELPMRRTLDAVGEYVRELRGRADSIVAIATSALRRAENALAFAVRVRELVGADLVILDGPDEARYSFLGAVAALPRAERYGVADSGGGSTEYATGTHDRVERTVSCEIGAVRLTEAVPILGGDRGAIDDASMADAMARAVAILAPVGALPAVDRLVFVGGSATTAAAILRGNRDPFESFELSRTNLRLALAQLRALNLDARRRLPGMNPQRADILPAGLILLDAIFALAGHERATVSTSDLLYGYLLAQRESHV